MNDLRLLLFQRNLDIFFASIRRLRQDSLFAEVLLANLAVIVLVGEQKLDEPNHERILKLPLTHCLDDSLN